jgi:hypothetical protein
MAKRNRNCIWHCGRETKNISHICDHCWKAAEILRSNSDAGYKAWCGHKRAKEAATEKRPMSEKHRAALDKARRAKLLKQLPASETLT